MFRTMLPFVAAAAGGPIRVVDIVNVVGIVYVLVAGINGDVVIAAPSATVTPTSVSPGGPDGNSGAERKQSISRRVDDRRIGINRRCSIDDHWIVGGNVNNLRIGLLNHDDVLAFDRLGFHFLLLAGF